MQLHAIDYQHHIFLQQKKRCYVNKSQEESNSIQNPILKVSFVKSPSYVVQQSKLITKRWKSWKSKQRVVRQPKNANNRRPIIFGFGKTKEGNCVTRVSSKQWKLEPRSRLPEESQKNEVLQKNKKCWLFPFLKFSKLFIVFLLTEPNQNPVGKLSLEKSFEGFSAHQCKLTWEKFREQIESK